MMSLLGYLRLKSGLKRVPFIGWALVRAKKAINRARNAVLLALDRYPKATDTFEDAPWDCKSFLPKVTVPVVTNGTLATRERRASLNKLCDLNDFFSPDFQRVYAELVEPVGDLDRRSWEYVEGILGLERLGVVRPDSVCLSVASGCEKPIYYFANKCLKVYAADRYLDDSPWWPHTANGDIFRNPAKYAAFPYRRDHLKLVHMDATKLEFPDCKFDFVFSYSSIEHFGSREAQGQAMREMERVVKPGGVVMVSTEYIISHAKHNEYFDREDLERAILRSHGMELIGGPIDLRLSDLTLRKGFDPRIGAASRKVSLVYRDKEVVFVPVMMFFRKASLAAPSIS